MSPESPEPDDSYTLTPRTEAKYNKIDEDFQMMMQRNQQLASNRMGGGGNYTLPVSVPVGSYSDANMLQASPQMAHQNIRKNSGPVPRYSLDCAEGSTTKFR